MALWDKGTEEVTCRHCGARHVADYREYLLSSIGSQGCLKCGNELISWNGPRDYIEFRLVWLTARVRQARESASVMDQGSALFASVFLSP